MNVERDYSDMANHRETAIKEVRRLRNRHVAKLLSYLGDLPPYLESAIKAEFSMFANDVEDNIINSDNREPENGTGKKDSASVVSAFPR